MQHNEASLHTPRLQGIFPVVPTIFREDGSLDPGGSRPLEAASLSADSSAALTLVPARSRCRSTPEMAHVFCT